MRRSDKQHLKNTLAATLTSIALFPAGSVSAATVGDPSMPARTVLIGDSRIEGMHMSVGDADCLWEYEVGRGYDWLVNTGVPEIDQTVGDGTAVVITLGINDIGDTGRSYQYASYINSKAQEWAMRGAATYYVSVTNLSDGYKGANGVDNEHVAMWNASLRGALSNDVTFIDANSVMPDIETVDGIHYTSDTYRSLFQVIYQKVENDRYDLEYTTNDNLTTIIQGPEDIDQTEAFDAPIDEESSSVDDPFIDSAFTDDEDQQNTISGDGEVSPDGVVLGVYGSGTYQAPEDYEVLDLSSNEEETEVLVNDETSVEINETTEVEETNIEAVPGVIGYNDEKDETVNDAVIDLISRSAMLSIETGSDDYVSEAEEENEEDASETSVEAVPGVVGYNSEEERIDKEKQAKTMLEELQTELPDTDMLYVLKEDDEYQTEGSSAIEDEFEETETESETEDFHGDMIVKRYGTAEDSEAKDKTPSMTGWQKSSFGTSYYDRSGEKIKGEETIDDESYIFDDDGLLLTDTLRITDGRTTYSTSDGSLVIGWADIGEDTFYFDENGRSVSGIQSIDNEDYLFDQDGKLCRGMTRNNGNIYLLNSEGILLDGWQMYEGKTYYMTTDGLVTGLQDINGSTYLFDKNGALLTGETTIDGITYYLDRYGKPQTSWIKRDDRIYYLSQDGSPVKGWQRISAETYYFNENGEMVTGIISIDGDEYRFAEDGKLIEKLDPMEAKDAMAIQEEIRDIFLFPEELKIDDGDLSNDPLGIQAIFTRMNGEEEVQTKELGHYSVSATYEECFLGDTFDLSKVHVTYVDENGVGSLVTNFTVGDALTNPDILTGDVMLTVRTSFGDAQLVIIPKKREEDVMDLGEDVAATLNVSYEGTVYEGDTLSRSKIKLTAVDTQGNEESISDFTIEGPIDEPIVTEQSFVVSAKHAEATLTITPITVSYVEPVVTEQRHKGEFIDPAYVKVGYTNGTFVQLPITECKFGIQPKDKILVEGRNEYPVLIHGSEYVMVYTAQVDD